jgi:hypothetical protein
MMEWKDTAFGKSVPFCRAANGALAPQRRRRPDLRMKPLHALRFLHEWIAWLGAQRWRKEILLAIVLTLAAAVFLASALVGSHVAQEVEAPLATAGKPQH